MKKIVFFAVALVAAGALFGCKKQATTSVGSEKLDLRKKVDASVWLDNLTDGKIAAQQADKKIVLFFSADDQDQLSQILKDNLLNKSEFLADITNDYVLVNLDFSNDLYEKSLEDETLSATLEANMKLATVYGVQMSPMFFLLTKEGYPIVPLFYDDTLKTTEDFRSEFETNADDIAAFEEAYAKTTEGSNEEKVQAIDALFELVDPRQTYLFTPLAQQVLTLDPKNKTGLVGKYVLAVADAQATDAAMNNDPQAMVDVFAEAAKNKYLNADEKQQAYYYAGYFLAGSGSPDYDLIKEYVQKSYDAAPTSERAPQIAQLLEVIDQRIADIAGMGEDMQQASEAQADGSQSEATDDAASAENTFSLE